MNISKKSPKEFGLFTVIRGTEADIAEIKPIKIKNGIRIGINNNEKTKSKSLLTISKVLIF